jgi:hypothetical protein
MKMHMMSRAVCLSVLAATSVFATTLEKLALDDMIVKSTEIVRGRVASITSLRRGSLILTQVRVAVSERWKGPDGASVDVFLHGGTFQGLRQTFSGTPELTQGSEYVFFLWAGQSGNRQIIGLSQGVLDIQPTTAKAGTAELTAHRAAIDGMVDAATGQQTQDAGLTIPLSQLRARIQRVLAQEKQ